CTSCPVPSARIPEVAPGGRVGGRQQCRVLEGQLGDDLFAAVRRHRDLNRLALRTGLPQLVGVVDLALDRGQVDVYRDARPAADLDQEVAAARRGGLLAGGRVPGRRGLPADQHVLLLLRQRYHRGELPHLPTR